MRGIAVRRRWVVAATAAVVTVVLAVVVVLVVRGGGGGTPTAAPTTTSSTTTTSTSTTTTTTPSGPTTAGTTTARPSRTTTPPTTTPPRPTTPAPTTTAAPAPPFPAALRGQDVTVLPTSRRVVALTFDAGANAAGLPSILRTLSAKGVRATFFLTGTWASANPGSVAAIRAAGHRIGNHSATHADLTRLTDAQIRGEVLGAQATIQAAGADPRPLFRFPSGARDARTIAAVNALGYVAVRWTVDTLGWEGTAGGISAQQVTDRALASLRPGEIVLMHVGSNPDDGTTFDADALPGTIDRMRAAGYGFVTLDALLG